MSAFRIRERAPWAQAQRSEKQENSEELGSNSIHDNNFWQTIINLCRFSSASKPRLTIVSINQYFDGYGFKLYNTAVPQAL